MSISRFLVLAYRLSYLLPAWSGTEQCKRYVWCIDRVVDGLLRKVELMANWYNGFCSLQCCSWMRLPLWWNVWINNCSYGINSDVFWIGLRSDMVSVRVPYSCMLFRICRAYVDWGIIVFYISYVFVVPLCQIPACLAYVCFIAGFACQFVYTTFIVVLGCVVHFRFGKVQYCVCAFEATFMFVCLKRFVIFLLLNCGK